MPPKLYMVVERFKNKDAVPVYRRSRERGRMTPDGLVYVSSWVDEKLERCYQLMETRDRALLDQWMANWSDLVDFEVHPVMTSKEAAEKIAPRPQSRADTGRSPPEVLRGYILDVSRDPPLVAEGVLHRAAAIPVGMVSRFHHRLTSRRHGTLI